MDDPFVSAHLYSRKSRAAMSQPVRSFVLSGQGGWFTSSGMFALKDRLERLGPTSFHSWRDETTLSLLQEERGAVAVVGYSLGANQIGWLGAWSTSRPIDLGIAYDPSKLSPLAVNGVQRVINVKRVLCYWNPDVWWFGGAKMEGRGVELLQIHHAHLAVQFDESLHARTVAEVTTLANNDRSSK